MFSTKNEVKAWEEGLFAGANGLKVSNPYPNESRLYNFWKDGFALGKLVN